jgi:hypothetical protein
MFAAATKFLTTVQEMLNPLRDESPAGATHQIDDIRHAMLNCLGPDGRSDHPHVEQRILLAPNVSALWFLRPELLMVLAARNGEQAARELIDEITVMFRGLLPKSLNSRPSPLQR